MAVKIQWKWNIPNVISLVRILLVPVFVVMYLKGLKPDQQVWQYWSFGVLVLSGLTDCVDGYIARRFNQITDLGKVLDPIADKLTQVAVLVCLTVYRPRLLPLLIICFVKELCQVIGSAIMLRRNTKVDGAKWYGKISTIVFYGAMAALVLWEDMSTTWVTVLTVLVAALMLFAFVQYTRLFIRVYKESAVNDTEKKE